jgi:hypothetical protein
VGYEPDMRRRNAEQLGHLAAHRINLCEPVPKWGVALRDTL